MRPDAILGDVPAAGGDGLPARPRLVYFQYRYDRRLPEFLLIHKDEHVRCLSHFFDVRVITEDCDYSEVCDKHQPALALFELGLNPVHQCERPEIANVRANPHIPKIALHHADAWCNARGGFLADLARLEIETVFSISTTAGEHTPELAGNLFYWPVFVDAGVFRDYGVWKSIPVLLTGNTSALYPWRNRIFRLIRDRFPAMACPHPGYGPMNSPAAALIGERYARTINASWCVPSCGTVAREVVRKHFEVPASGACLITQRSVGLEMAGFEDMRNCLFLEEADAVEKLAWLLSDEAEITRITRAGHELVHSRHTSRHRNQIREWFELQQGLSPSEKIVQLNPFDAPVVTSRSSGMETVHGRGGGLHLQLLADADAALQAGDYLLAEQLYLRCVNLIPWMPEPQFRLALTGLYMGRVSEAEARLEPLLQFILFKYRAEQPDPVEWAFYIVVALCGGKLDVALEHAKQFPSLRHPELDRVRWACRVSSGAAGASAAPLPSGPDRRKSIHRLPERSLADWTAQLSIMLRACGRNDMATSLSTSLRSIEGSISDSRHGVSGASSEDPRDASSSASSRPTRSLHRKMLATELKVKVRNILSAGLHRAEQKYGYFLPYHLSSVRSDGLFSEISREAQNEDVSFALLIGAVAGSPLAGAFLSGLRRNVRRPTAICMVEQGKLPASRQEPGVRFLEIGESSPEGVLSAIDASVKCAMREHGAAGRSLVVLNGEAWRHLGIRKGLGAGALSRASTIILSGTDSLLVHETLRSLERSSGFDVYAADAVHHGGYVLLRRRIPVEARDFVEAE